MHHALRRGISWLIITLIIFVLGIWAFADEVDREKLLADAEDARVTLREAHALLRNETDGAETLLKEGVRLLRLGVPWEGSARMLMARAVEQADKVLGLLTPLTARPKEYPASLIALACWYEGNARMFRMAGSARVIRNELIVGKKHSEMKGEIMAAEKAYKCALLLLSSPEGMKEFSRAEEERYKDIIRKNFLVSDAVSGQLNPKSDSQVDGEKEMKVLETVLGKQIFQEGGRERVVIPVPPQEGQRSDKSYSPGSIGIH